MEINFFIRELRFSDPPDLKPVFATVRVMPAVPNGLMATEFIDVRFRLTGVPHGPATAESVEPLALAQARRLVNESEAALLLAAQKAE